MSGILNLQLRFISADYYNYRPKLIPEINRVTLSESTLPTTVVANFTCTDKLESYSLSHTLTVEHYTTEADGLFSISNQGQVTIAINLNICCI